MVAKLIDGKKISADLCQKINQKVNILKEKYNIVPGLAVILVGHDKASSLYVNNKSKKAQEIGINSKIINLNSDISEQELLDVINNLNIDKNINGILVQLPLPKHIDKLKIINAIVPNKDVDGFHLENSGKLFTEQRSIVPCTPKGCLILLKEYFSEPLIGKKVVIFGRSNIVGKPMAELLSQELCTVTSLHKDSKNKKKESSVADIIISAVGKPKLIDSSYIKEGVVIIDVGINYIDDNGVKKIVGDVDFDSVKNKAEAITPVPGGVGPMTIACLMLNSFYACLEQNSIKDNELYNIE